MFCQNVNYIQQLHTELHLYIYLLAWLHLGMWADEEEDDGRQNKHKRKEQKSYNAPVAFVSGGIKIGDKVTKENPEEEDDDISVSFHSCLIHLVLLCVLFI